MIIDLNMQTCSFGYKIVTIFLCCVLLIYKNGKFVRPSTDATNGAIFKHVE